MTAQPQRPGVGADIGAGGHGWSRNAHPRVKSRIHAVRVPSGRPHWSGTERNMKRSTNPVGHGRAALVAVLLAATLALAACGSSGGSSPTSAPAPASASPSIPVGSSTQSMTIGGMQRSYRVYRPKSLPASAPLVVMLHGALGTAQQAES